jgi:hypothetical protein
MLGKLSMYPLRNFYPRPRLSYVPSLIFLRRFLVVAGRVIFHFFNSGKDEV